MRINTYIGNKSFRSENTEYYFEDGNNIFHCITPKIIVLCGVFLLTIRCDTCIDMACVYVCIEIFMKKQQTVTSEYCLLSLILHSRLTNLL